MTPGSDLPRKNWRRMRAVWITWERQRRNRSMAASVGAVLHELEYKGNSATATITACSRSARYL